METALVEDSQQTTRKCIRLIFHDNPEYSISRLAVIQQPRFVQHVFHFGSLYHHKSRVNAL